MLSEDSKVYINALSEYLLKLEGKNTKEIFIILQQSLMYYKDKCKEVFDNDEKKKRSYLFKL